MTARLDERMSGPEIMARSITATRIPDKFGNEWQYHSRSDRHSKVACWAIMFDLLNNCPLLRQHVMEGKVGFGINHELRDFQTERKKNLDLVVCTPNRAASVADEKRNHGKAENLAELVTRYGVVLLNAEASTLRSLPAVPIVSVGAVNLALEAKATMTEHVKALPRLHDELDSSHATVHGHADHAIAAALVTVNIARHFISADRNKHDLRNRVPVGNTHDQPKAAMRTIAKVREVRRRSRPTEQGFDAVGIVLVDFVNDGTPCRIIATRPAPAATESDHYDQMIRRISSLYAAKFVGQ